MFCLYVPWEFSFAADLGLGICPGFCPRCWWHHLFSACSRFWCCCQLCIFELVLSVLYFTPKLVFLWISWCDKEVLVTSQLIGFCKVCPTLQHCLFLSFVLYESAKNSLSIPKQLSRLISLHCALLQHPLCSWEAMAATSIFPVFVRFTFFKKNLLSFQQRQLSSPHGRSRPLESNYLRGKRSLTSWTIPFRTYPQGRTLFLSLMCLDRKFASSEGVGRKQPLHHCQLLCSS